MLVDSVSMFSLAPCKVQIGMIVKGENLVQRPERNKQVNYCIHESFTSLNTYKGVRVDRISKQNKFENAWVFCT